MLIIPYAANTENYRELADEYKNRVAQEQQLREATDNQYKVGVAHLNKVIETLNEQNSKQKSEMDKIAGDLENRNNELLAERNTNKSLTSQLNQLNNILAASDAERKVLQSQLQQLTKDNSGVRTDNFRLTEENQKLTLQRQLYEQEIRLLKEQNFSLSDRLEKIRSKSAVPTQAEASPAVPGKAQAADSVERSSILGEITEIRDNLASISVGSAQGVRDGMEFTIYRNNQYLGKLRITKVLADQSAGELISKQGTIRNGDKVTDHLQF
jgi:chromosome segregation ATPase